MDYFRIIDNLDEPANRWFLGSVNFDNEWDFWKYTDTGNFELPGRELSITIRRQGVPLDFTMADFELLVINSKIAALLDTDEVMLIPLIITGHFSDIDYYTAAEQVCKK